MYIVCGCPRSGTSLMMEILRNAYGDGRLFGAKFMNRDQEVEIQDKRVRDILLYNIQKKRPMDDSSLARMKDMNPNGFWESQFVIDGIKYHVENRHVVDNMLNAKEAGKPYICKIVSQGIYNSDPRYISKIIYMLRHPREIAKSQEKLKRSYPDFIPVEFRQELSDNFIIHSPEMFINVAAAVSRWLLANKIPTLIVDYSDLVSKPGDTLKKISDFLAEPGDWKKAATVIDPGLKRSEPQPIPSPLWEDAEAIYGLFKDGDYAGIVRYMSDEKKQINRKNRRWLCSRTDLLMDELKCRACKTDRKSAERFRNFSEQNKIDWRKEPCAFECGFDLDNPPVTVEQSIASNHWL